MINSKAQIVATVENQTPTRAEVTDVANAILQGADAVRKKLFSKQKSIYPARPSSIT